jgi:hypothetical protein
MFSSMECWYPADGLVNRCYKNSQKYQKHCTCAFVFCVVIYCVCLCVCFLMKFWLVVKINRPGPCKKEFLRDCQRESEEKFCFIEVRATVSVFCWTGVLIFKNCSRIWKASFKHIAFLLTKTTCLIVNARKIRKICTVWWNRASWDV